MGKTKYRIDLEDDYNKASENNEIVQIVKAVMCENWDDSIYYVINLAIPAISPTKAIEYINNNKKYIKNILYKECKKIYGKKYKCKYIEVEV